MQVLAKKMGVNSVDHCFMLKVIASRSYLVCVLDLNQEKHVLKAITKAFEISNKMAKIDKVPMADIASKYETIVFNPFKVPKSEKKTIQFLPDGIVDAQSQKKLVEF